MNVENRHKDIRVPWSLEDSTGARVCGRLYIYASIIPYQACV